MTGALLVLSLLLGCTQAGTPLTAAECGTCHASQYEAWSQSAHAASGKSEVFTKLTPKVEHAWGGLARARCENCHLPNHGETTGITCLSCHAALGNRGEHDGQLIVDVAAPLAGPKAPESAPHAVTTRGLLSSASLCITCHEVTGPGLFEEPTGTEFRAATTDDAACASCHFEGHRFRGQPRLVEALKLEVSASGDVTLTNIGAGHAVPTGVAVLRDIWVDLELERDDGTVLQVPRVLELGSRLRSGSTEVALPTDAEHVESRALAPRQSRTAHVIFPAGVRAVTAHLRSRPVRAAALEALELEVPPPTEVATARAASL